MMDFPPPVGYLEGAYLDLLKAALKKELGVSAKLVYVVTPVKKQPALVYPAAHAYTSRSLNSAPFQISLTLGSSGFSRLVVRDYQIVLGLGVQGWCLYGDYFRFYHLSHPISPQFSSAPPTTAKKFATA